MELIKLLYDYGNEFSKNKDDLCNEFKFPIELLKEKKLISENIINDLELLEYKNNQQQTNENLTNKDSLDNIDRSNEIINNYKSNLYYNVFNPTNNYEKNIISKWASYYTNDKNYLKDTQNLLQNYKNNVEFNIESIKYNDNNNDDYDLIKSDYEDIIYNEGFVNNYQYIDLPYFNKYNTNIGCMQILSIYNIYSSF